MLALSKKDIFQALDWNEALDAVAEGFAALSLGRAQVPLRTVFDMPEENALTLLMPGAIHNGERSQLAVKIVSIFRNNPPRGFPLIYGLVTLFEADTGRPLAIFDGATLTAIRTGAASGVATRYLAQQDAQIMALFGTGNQAEMQIPAIIAARYDTLEEIRVVGRDFAKADKFALWMTQETRRRVYAVRSAAEALQGAQVVATATGSYTPVFQDNMLEPGVHINGIGSYQPDMREIPSETIARCRLVVDQREAALAEAGDVIIPLQAGLITEDSIYAELGEVITGLKDGRAGFAEHEVSFFKSVGNAVQDVVIANYLYQKARKLGLGTNLEL